MNEDYIERAKRCGIGYTNGLFKTFSVPENQGKNFKWEDFPDIAGQLSKVSLFTMFGDDEWYGMDKLDRKNLENQCYNFASQRAVEILSEG